MHKMSRTRFYNIWCKMKERCLNKNRQNYARYGGQGVKVCDAWHGFVGFKNDMYESYLKHVADHGEIDTTLDRIDSNGNYDPNNCRWATRAVQSENRNTNKNKKQFIATDPNGKTYIHYHQKQFADEHGLAKSGISDCLRGHIKRHRGWSFKIIRG